MAVPFLECVTNWSRKRIHGSAIFGMRPELVSKKNSWQCHFWNASRTGLEKEFMAVPFLECVPNWSRKRIHFGMRKIIHGSAIFGMRPELVSKKNSWQCLFWNAKNNSWQCHFWNASRTGLDKEFIAVPFLDCVTNWSRKRVHGNLARGKKKWSSPILPRFQHHNMGTNAGPFGSQRLQATHVSSAPAAFAIWTFGVKT